MAVRSSGSGQSYSTTSTLPTDPFTITCWAYLTNDRNAVSGIWGVAGSTNLALLTTSSGTVLGVTGSSGTVGSYSMSTTTWYKLAVVYSSINGTFYHAPAGSALTSDSGSLGTLISPTTFRIGCSSSTSEWLDGRIASLKVYNTALTAAQIDQELAQYLPFRTANLTHWHPFVTASTVDWSGNARTLSGGSGATTEAGPPIPWGPPRPQIMLPWDPSTTVWYAVYDTSTGELFSLGTVLANPLPGGYAYKTYLGLPDQSRYIWSPAALDFVLKEGLITIDRVDDMVADSSLISAGVWASLTTPESDALKSRLGQLLGSQRYRYDFQPVDLD